MYFDFIIMILISKTEILRKRNGEEPVQYKEYDLRITTSILYTPWSFLVNRVQVVITTSSISFEHWI